MLPRLVSENLNSKEESRLSRPCALWPVELTLTHVDCNPEDTLVHFQGQYLTLCELDYNILQVEIQNAAKTKAAVEVGELCLVEDALSSRWYRGRVQNKQGDVCDVFLIDHGNVLSVDVSHVATALDQLSMLPPKIVCGFFANVLPLQDHWDSLSERYFSSLIGSNVKGYIQALLPHKVLILDAHDINRELFRQRLGKHVDTDTFLLLVRMLTEAPLKQSSEPVPDLLIEKSVGQEFSFKPSSLQGFEDILSSCGPKLTAGKRVKVRVTAAVYPGTFYCQMTSMAKDLQVMSEKLALSCESRSKDPSKKPVENLGLLCSVKGKDETWHRGFVQFLPVNSQVRVLFVDYGFCESVKVENVLQLPADFLSTPIMAFPCALACLDGQDEAVKTQQLSWLKKGLLGGVLEVEIEGFDKGQNLYSVTVFSAENRPAVEAGPSQDAAEQRKCDFVSEGEQILPYYSHLYYETAMVQVLDNSLHVEKMQEDSVFEAYIEHVLNPNNFWLRTQKRNHDFDEMMNKMAEYYSQIKLDEEVLEDPEPGAMCCAMFEKDMHYYRAVVTDTLDNGAEVFFLDFGNTEKVPHMLIKQLPDKFASEPPFVLSCSLVNVLPVGDVWTITSTDYFRRAVSNKALLVHVVHMGKDRYVVDLYVKETPNNKSISELLTKAHQAEYWKFTPSEPAIKGKAGQNKMAKHKVCQKRPVRKNGICTSGVSESHVSVPTVERENRHSVITKTPKEMVPDVAFKAQTFKLGSELSVHCSHIASPSDFWCQLQSKRSTLDKLMDEMQQYYKTHTVPVQPGVSCCVAKASDDGRWYRACIIGAQKDYVEVVFVDYGMIVREHIRNFQAILPEHLELEGQAFRCSLYNLPVEDSHGGWSPEACDVLKEYVLDQSFNLTCSIKSHLHVKNKGRSNVVDLCTAHNSAAKKLLERGLAREMGSPMQPLPCVRLDSFVYDSFNLKSGSEEVVYVTHVCSPWEMYCQLDKNSDIIEELVEKVTTESEGILRANAAALVGKLCLAKYYDGKWYRGVACRVQSPLHLGVFFVDYGNTYVVEKSNVMSIPSESSDLLFTPMQALRCGLSQISKEEDFAEVNRWLEMSILNRPLRAVVVGKNEDGTVAFDLFDESVSINEKIKQLIASQQPKEKNIIRLSHDTDSTKTINNKDHKHFRFPGKGGTCYRDRYQKRHYSKCSKRRRSQKECHIESKREKLVKSEENTDRKIDRRCGEHDTDNFSKLPPGSIELPQLENLRTTRRSAGFRGLGFVSHIDTVNSFFIQMQADEQTILDLGEDLNSELFKDTMGNNTQELRINDLVAAEFEEDGALYRAVVRDTAISGQFRVEFVDYGNTAVVGKDKTYFLTNKHLSQPRLSIPCTLRNTDSFESDAYFTEAVIGKPLMVKFCSRFGAQWEVDIEIQDAYPTQADDSNAVTENEEALGWSESPADPEIKQPACQLSSLAVTEEESNTESGRVKIFTAQGEKLSLKVSSTTMRSSHCHQHGTGRQASRSTSSPPCEVTFEPSAEPVNETVIPPQSISFGQTECGTLLSILENGDLCVRVNRSTEEFTVLENLLVEKQSQCEIMSKEDVKEGLQCLIKSTKDNQWYRAIVQHASADQGEYRVFLLDHGTTEEVPANCIKELCNDLKQIPVQAILCKWNGPGLPTQGDEASKIMKETLKAMVGKDIKFMFVSYSDADNLWMVEIMMNGLFLIQQLKTASQQQQPPTEEKATPAKACAATVTEGESVLDDRPLQRLFLAPVKMDQGYSGSAAAVTTPWEFYIVLEDLLLIMNTVSTVLHDLPQEMPALPEAHLLPGSSCLVRSDTKNRWCRAEVVQVDGTAALINLVDYGHCVNVPYARRSELRQLPEQLTRLPKVTYPCALRGVKPIRGGQWTDEAVVFFQECICQKNLQIYFRQYISEAHWEVDLVADGVHVAKELVDAGHADYTDVMLRLRFRNPAERTARAEPEMSPERTDTPLGTMRSDDAVGLEGRRSPESFWGQRGERSSSDPDSEERERTDHTTEGVERMRRTDTMSGTTQCALM